MKLKTILTGFLILCLTALCLLVPTNFDVHARNVNGINMSKISGTGVNYIEFAPPTYTDQEYKERVMAIPQAEMLSFTYNSHVRSGIEAYTVIHRNTAESVLGLKEIYFPMFEEALARHGVPKGLRYLAIIESALKPTAKSPAGAAGLWQFISSTGKENGLRINSEVDERLDPRLSSEAAARFLARLHKKFGNWLLVIAAYNCGPTRVSNAIKKAGSRDIWKLYKYLPKETRGYVPLFIGSAYLVNYYHFHQLNPVYPEAAYYDVETTTVYDKMSFKSISELSGTPMYQVEYLNPSFKKKYIPAYRKGYTLVLPKLGMATWRGDYSAAPPVVASTYTPPPAKTYVPPAATQNTYTRVVSPPPTPVVTEDVVVSKPRPVVVKKKKKKKKKKKVKYVNDRKEKPVGERETVKIKVGGEEKEVVIYEMKRGDNLSMIASKYPGVTVKDIIRLNNIKDYRKLRRGTRLYIGS